MRNFSHFLASKKGQILFNVLYSWGAAVVIFGTMCKIMHFRGGDWILMAGMIVEVIVFIAAGLDYSSSNVENEDSSAGGVILGGGFMGGSAVGISDSAVASTPNKEKGGKPVVVVGGSGGTYSGGVATGNVPSSIVGTANPEYAQSLSNTAQHLEDFSQTIHSLNEVSQKILNAYTQVTDNQGFADNLVTLNRNVSGLNEVFNSQIQTITEQMSAIRYINDSLQRMKNLYDGAIGDSYMFKEESAKMTKHIEALNNVYARLLQAMTTNNNNMNHTNF